ncbi:apyrase-like [Cotesia glomerata]|uniref:apyrase n=1 Tax=Cotesia glomerata TaxID=32391 RepID=A0AAV7IAS4_COTGL|nr:apyrase-like [Cotesia glomerata]XP_044591603.1 apyrase-like [Cotesia glomerata]XP_044591604.1 apyrase-like [Cotesia glomerata]XP_044591605.1 apyrase-like [Cotesia glomerata]KAH0547161.1 hypothetical protein KQX54_017322 [Cotesia glomerata]
MIKQLLILIAIKCTSGLTGRGLMYPGRTDLFELSIVHINDFHARFEEVSPTASACERKRGAICVGGLPRVFTAAKRLFKERPNAILLNAGDHYQGTLWYNLHRWNVTVTFFNMVPWDVLTIGNHEFDDGIAGLVPFLKNIKAPVVITNIDMSDEPTMQNLTTNSTILYRGGKKIGVIGAIIKTTTELSKTEKLKFLDEIETINLEAEKLKLYEKVDIIIVLSHCGLPVDRKIAANCPLVDVIVGGHSHSFLYSGEAPFIDQPVDEYPVVVTQASNRTVLIVQAAAFTKYLGNLTVWFNAEGEVEDWEGNPIVLDETIQQDPEMLKALEPWKKQVDALGSKVIGRTKVKMPKTCRVGECNIGNMITDAMIESFIDRAEDESYWSFASIAVTNGGGIRSPIDSASGDITFADLVMAQPFENYWDIIEMKGSDIRMTLEICVARSQPGHWNGYSFLVWSGLRVFYNMSQPVFSRVDSVKVQCRQCDVPVYENLLDHEWYRVVVPTFLLRGGDGHSVIASRHRNHVVGGRDIDFLVKYVKKISPLMNGLEGRIVFV